VILIHPAARVELRAAWLVHGEVSERLAARFQGDIRSSAAAHGRRRPQYRAARLDDTL
jgi:hypothetical protein